jgi:hypothetical protein
MITSELICTARPITHGPRTFPENVNSAMKNTNTSRASQRL